MDLILVTSNFATKEKLFRAGGITFALSLLKHFKREFGSVELIIGSSRDEVGEIDGVGIRFVRGIYVPVVEKVLLPKSTEKWLGGKTTLFLDYVPLLTLSPKQKSAVVLHHFSTTFKEENPKLFLRYFGLPGLIYSYVEPILLKRILGKVNAHLCVSPVAGNTIAKMGFNPVVVGNGVDVRKYRGKKKEDYAIAIGRLVNYKRFEMAIEVARRTGVKLVIVGDGPLRKKLEKIAPENVTLVGYVSEKEKIELLAHASALLNFSAFEGFNLPLIEAMASETVPIASDIAINRFVFSGRKVGFLVRNVEEAVEHLQEVIENRKLLKQLGKEGRRLVEERWNAEKIAKKYIEILKSLE